MSNRRVVFEASLTVEDGDVAVSGRVEGKSQDIEAMLYKIAMDKPELKEVFYHVVSRLIEEKLEEITLVINPKKIRV